MSSTTPNLGLTVPAMGDQISSTIPALGTNFQTIDNQIGILSGNVGFYISNSLINSDISAVLNTAFADPTIYSVHIPEGTYLLSQKVTIPTKKCLVMKGNNGSKYLTASQVNDKLFTVIKATFDGDYCFEMSDMSTIRDGFINCESMTSGGAISIDISQTAKSRINVIGTVMSGGNNMGLNGIFINCDRPSGTNPGFGYFYNFDCGIQGFGIGIYLKRQDTYNTTSGPLTGQVVWINGIRITGHMSTCQRYVFFDTSNNLHAAGSSVVAPIIQAGSVPNPNLPAVDIGGDDCTLSAQFFDVFTGGTQTVRYNIRSGASNTIVTKYNRGETDITDGATDTIYLTDAKNAKTVYNTISTINGGVAVQDGWYTKVGNTVTLNFQFPNCPIYTGWTTVYTLPYIPSAQTRKTVPTIDNRWVSILLDTSGNLQVINNNAAAATFNLQVSYPTNS